MDTVHRTDDDIRYIKTNDDIRTIARPLFETRRLFPLRPSTLLAYNRDRCLFECDLYTRKYVKYVTALLEYLTAHLEWLFYYSISIFVPLLCLHYIIQKILSLQETYAILHQLFLQINWLFRNAP